VASFVAVYDACVLHPAALRDLLLHLALMRLFRARWTDRIHDEWIRSLLERRADIDPARLARTRARMDAAVPGALVTGYDGLIDQVVLVRSTRAVRHRRAAPGRVRRPPH
jgi:hypothetical protein